MLLRVAALAAAGAGAGAMGSILGIGGGVFLVPALVLWFDIPMPHAVAAGLVAVIATSSSAGSVNVQRGLVNMRLAMVLEIATVLGALLGAWAGRTAAPQILIACFGLLLAALAVLLWRKSEAVDAPALPEPPTRALDARYLDPATEKEIAYRPARLPLALAVSFGAGGLSGMLGIGGGVVKVPVMNLFCAIPMKAAAATSNFMIGVTAAASAFLYYKRGLVAPAATAVVVLGVLAGSALAAVVGGRLKDGRVRRAFALLLVFLSIQMLRRAAHG